MYDYLVAGTGLYGAILARDREAINKGCMSLVIDKRDNVGGNIYTKKVVRVNVQKYGAHIFHNNNQKVVEYITQYATCNCFTNSPVANYKGELYTLPVDMYTFNKIWGVVTPEKTVISRENSSEWKLGDELYYPINDEKNGLFYKKYTELTDKEENVIFGGGLGEYKYYDMDVVIASELERCKKEL